jgi:hypothetical protein
MLALPTLLGFTGSVYAINLVTDISPYLLGMNDISFWVSKTTAVAPVSIRRHHSN